MLTPTTSARLLKLSLWLLAAALPVSIAGTNIALGLTTLALGLYFASGGRPGPVWPSGAVAKCLWLYLGIGILTALAGVFPHNSIIPLQKDCHKLWAFYILTLAFAAAPDDRLHLPLALGSAFIAAIGIGQSAICAYSGWRHPAADWQMIRAAGFVHPVTFGSLTAFAALGCISFLGQSLLPQKHRKWTWLLLAGSLTALLLSQTRAAFLGLGAGFAVMCLAEPRLRPWLKYALAAALLGVVILELLPTHRSLISSIREHGVSASANSQMARFVLWKTAWRIFCDHPWLGAGPGNYAAVFADYYQGVIDGQRVWGAAHNIFLHQLAERGILGFAALLALWTALLLRAWRRWQAENNAWNLFALSVTVAFLVMNLTENAFQNEQIATLFLLIWTRAQSRKPEAMKP